jgi:1,4-dihydroxy-2-naphthoyl-CoA hydrolase
MAKPPTQYAGNIEFRIVEETPEKVIGEMPVQSGILNPFGIAHAGAMLWFADVCATLLANGGADMAPGGAGFPLGVSLNANVVGNQKDGMFTATSVSVKRGRQLIIVRTTITGAEGRMIADITTSHILSAVAPIASAERSADLGR